MITNKGAELLTFEGVLGQLRHAYALMTNDLQAWAPEQRKAFAERLVGPTIEKLETLARDFERLEDDLTTAFRANARYRRRICDIEEALLAHTPDIVSASSAKRIIREVFHAHSGEPDARDPSADRTTTG